MHGDAGRRAPANAAQPPPSRLPARPRDPTGPPRRRGRPAEPAAGRWTHHGGHFRLDGAVTTPHPPTRPLTRRPLRLPLPARRFGGPSQVLRRAAAPLGCRAGRCAGRRAEGCCSTTRWAVGTPQNHRYGRGGTRASARPHRRPRAARGRGVVWYDQAELRRARGWPGARSSARSKAWWSRFDLFRPISLLCTCRTTAASLTPTHPPYITDAAATLSRTPCDRRGRARVAAPRFSAACHGVSRSVR